MTDDQQSSQRVHAQGQETLLTVIAVFDRYREWVPQHTFDIGQINAMLAYVASIFG